MKRRRLIAIISLCTLAALGILGVVAGMVVIRTGAARNFVQTFIASRIHGSVHLGRISGNPLAGITIDSLAIRDTTGELVVSTGRISLDYDIRDIVDSRIHLRHVTVDRPHVHLRDFGEGRWNYMMSRTSGNRPGPKGAARSWGRFVVLDSVRVTNASFFLSMPWTPDDTLRGRVRDSVVAFNLARTDRQIDRHARSVSGFSQTYMWTNAKALIARARIADPDSAHLGQEFRIAELEANEFFPPFRFRNVRGVVQRRGDSAWLNISHFDLPGSTGSATGKLVWGSGLPIRYDLVVHGDSVTLADINWVYSTLPKTGSGSMVLRIANKRNVRVMDYHVDSMNVRSTGSHLVGEMTFGVGGGSPLQIRNVNLRAWPLDFALIETLSGKPLPVPWRGQIFGDVTAPGGPVDDFDVTAFRGEWRDANVPGAVSRMSGSGGLDIQFPALTAFKDFDLNVQALDLRSIQHLFPAFPKLFGTIAGRATLDSIWTDVRFSNADITHRDGPGTPSRFTGSGRITDGSPFITYDVDLTADPVSFDMLRRSFPRLTLRGLAYGPIRITGQSPDLQIATDLRSAAGAFRFAGNIDIDSLGGYGARGVGEFREVNLARLGIRDSAPVTSLTGAYTVDVRGATPGTLTGGAQVRLGRSIYDRIPLDSTSRASVRFDQGRVITSDTVFINSPFGRVTALGALGLPGGGSDSVAVTLVVDSVGNLTPYFTPEGAPARADSVGGMVVVNGVARGRVDSLLLSGVIAADSLFVRGLSVQRLRGRFSFTDLLRAPSGVVVADAWGAKLGGLRFDSVATRVDVIDSLRSTFSVEGRSFNGDSLSLSSTGGWALGAATIVRLDSMALSFGNSRWRLEQPATLSADATMVRVDTVGLRSARGATIGLAGVSPVNGQIDFRISAAQVPLSDIDRVVGQVQAPVSGFADLDARMLGTRESPIISARTTLDSIRLSNVGIGRLYGSANYADKRATLSAEIYQGAKQVLSARGDSLPIAVRWLTYDTLPGRVSINAVADSADFTLIQAWVPDISNVVGKMSGRVAIDGTWARPSATADVSVVDGGMRIDTLGIALSKLYGRVSLRDDTLRVDTLSATSGGDANSASVGGRIAFGDGWWPSWFDLSMRMNDFLAYDRPELATIYARTDSGPVRLRGTFANDTLWGVVQVDRGAIYLPDPKLVGKRYSALDTIGFRTGRTDTTLLQRMTEHLTTDLRAHIGGEFRLEADYANIPLTGDLRIVPVASTDVASRSQDFVSRLAPVGTIYADRGTYRLELPPLPFSKEFDVQRGGTITFDRDAQWNGVMNISARYVVRKPGQPEVPIIVDVTDRLLTPRVRPRSEATFPISESDLISYLVFDEPGIDIVGQVSRTFTGEGGLVTSLFTPIATSFFADQLRTRVLGGWLDQLRISTANLDQSGTRTTLGSFAFATRLTGAKEVFPNVFASVSYGLCGLNSEYRAATTSGENAAFSQLGANLDWRLNSSLTSGSSFQFAGEPSTFALLCSPGYSGSLGVAPTPRQYSLSFLKFWRW